MTLLSCITALTLSAVVIYSPLKLLSDVLLKQAEIEEYPFKPEYESCHGVIDEGYS